MWLGRVRISNKRSEKRTFLIVDAQSVGVMTLVKKYQVSSAIWPSTHKVFLMPLR